jgi:hypothetical protein
MSKATHQPLPYAPDRPAWSWAERSELGVHGTADVLHRVPSPIEESGAELPIRLRRALPLLFHEHAGLDLDDLIPPDLTDSRERLGLEPLQVIRRVVPRLLNFRYVESEQVREFIFGVGRPSSLHVLGRVLGTSFKLRLEDLSHFATHGELVVEVLDRLGINNVLDPEAILYCPALDSPFPFKFSVVGQGGPNRATYLRVLSKILRQTESDETFRARQFRELARGFQKFGPAVATPQFQEVELRLWRLLSYLAARLRVKAGRLIDTKDTGQARQFLAELREVDRALEDVEQLPSRLAAAFRSRFDLEFKRLYEHAMPELDRIAKRIDCDLSDRDRSIDAIANTVAEFRRLGSASPLESLEQQDRDIQAAYGDVPPEPPAEGWARTYTDTIHTGAERFDTRRFGASGVLDLGEEEENLDLDLGFLSEPPAESAAPLAREQVDAPIRGAAVGVPLNSAGFREAIDEIAQQAESGGEDDPSDSASDWRVQPGAEWSMGEIDLDAVLGSDDGTIPPSDEGDGEEPPGGFQ